MVTVPTCGGCRLLHSMAASSGLQAVALCVGLKSVERWPLFPSSSAAAAAAAGWATAAGSAYQSISRFSRVCSHLLSSVVL